VVVAVYFISKNRTHTVSRSTTKGTANFRLLEHGFIKNSNLQLLYRVRLCITADGSTTQTVQTLPYIVQCIIKFPLIIPRFVPGLKPISSNLQTLLTTWPYYVTAWRIIYK